MLCSTEREIAHFLLNDINGLPVAIDDERHPAVPCAKLVPEVGVEPTCLAAADFESAESADSSTQAKVSGCYFLFPIINLKFAGSILLTGTPYGNRTHLYNVKGC